MQNQAILYGILDLGYVDPDRAVEVARQLLEGGVDFLQLRAKSREPGLIREVALKVMPECRRASVPFILNDHLELAVELEADGLHLGQDDGGLEAARVRFPGKIIGRSTHSLAQARAAVAEGADYIGFGPIFPTPTKEGRAAIGMGDIAAMERDVGVRIPAFCIGGIKPENLAAVMGAGGRRFVIVSHLLQAGDVRAATAEVKTAISGNFQNS